MQSPFKFLDAYTREDRDIFFGREREIEEMYQKIFESKTLLVYGISGTGKTSLINCGLANKFQESDWLPISIRRGKNMNASLIQELHKVALTKLTENISIEDAVQSIYLDHFKPIYLIFDQFEELFIFGTREERDQFIQTITRLIQSDLQCRCLFSIREEYLANITEFEQLIDNILDNRIRVEKMTRSHAIEVIEGPCKVQGIVLEEGFAEALLEKLNPDSNEIELTFLQIFLDRVYSMATHDGEDMKFTLEMIEKMGDVSDLLGSFLEEQIKELDDPDIGMTLLKAFVSVKGTKRQVEESEVQDYVRALGKNVPLDKLKSLTQKFINLRILRDKDENGRYELRHDSLAAKIFEKITLVEKELLEIKQFIDNACENFQKREILLNKEDLDYIAPYENKLFLDKDCKDFLEKCHKNLLARKKTFQRILLISGVGFLITLVIIGVFSLRYSGNIKADNLAIISALQNTSSPILSYYTAKQAIKEEPNSSLAARSLFDAFYGLLDENSWKDSLTKDESLRYVPNHFSPADTTIIQATFSEDGEKIYGYLADNRVMVWERTGKLIFSDTGAHAVVLDLTLSPDNRYLGVVYKDSTAIVWDISNRTSFTLEPRYEPRSPKNTLVFSPDSRSIAIAGRDNQISIFDTNGDILYNLTGHTGPVNGLSFSPDSMFLASASGDSSIIFWKLDPSIKRFEKFKQMDDLGDSKVWSVDFASNSKYVLASLNDSIWENVYLACAIFNLNKRGRIHIYYFAETLSKPNNWDSPEPVYDAKFTARDAGFIYSTHMFLPDSFDFNNNRGFRYGLKYSDNSKIGLTRINRFLKKGAKQLFNKDTILIEYDGIDFSVHGYIAASPANTSSTRLFHWDGIPLREFQGENPVFSPEGDYLLCTDGCLLVLYPSSTDEILTLVDGDNLIKTKNREKEDWRKHLFRW